MWNENMVQDFYTDHGRNEAAPSRHEIARRAYVENIRSRHEAEQRAATIGMVASGISYVKTLAKTIYAGMQSRETQARPAAAEYPAE